MQSNQLDGVLAAGLGLHKLAPEAVQGKAGNRRGLWGRGWASCHSAQRHVQIADLVQPVVAGRAAPGTRPGMGRGVLRAQQVVGQRQVL